MSKTRDSRHLLSDVLGEGVPAEFRDALLKETLRNARHRRQIRHVRRVGSALVALVVVGLLAWHQFMPSSRVVRVPGRPYILVETQPLPAAAWVVTRPISPDNLVASVATENVVLTANSDSKVQDITDDELLALAPGPAALVRFGPHSAELVFVKRAETGEEHKN